MPPAFAQQFPLSTALGVKPVAKGTQALFDSDEVSKVLGTTRYNNLVAKLKVVYSCGHRLWPANHAEPNKRNAEVHCIGADDLEAFLKAGG